MNASKKSNFCCTSRMATSSWRWRTRADDLRDALRLLLARRFAGGDEIVRHAGQRRDDDDRLEVPPLGDDVDRVRDAIRIADGGAAELDDDHETPPAVGCSAGCRIHTRLASASCSAASSSPSLQQLGVQQRRSRGAANGVVHERDHAEVEQRAGAQAADRDGHAALAVAVEPRLRAVGQVDVVDRLAPARDGSSDAAARR